MKTKNMFSQRNIIILLENFILVERKLGSCGIYHKYPHSENPEQPALRREGCSGFAQFVNLLLHLTQFNW